MRARSTDPYGGPTSALPPRDLWVYGGHPYALEPLTLPPPTEPLREPVTPDGRAVVLFPPPPQDPEPYAADGLDRSDADAEELADRRAWFRWITGHQVSFVLWRLLSSEIGSRLGDTTARLPRSEDDLPVTRWEALVDGYSAMLLYSGSCTRARYHQLVRPSMRLQHPSFSGSWAPDYLGVRRVLHDRTSLGLEDSDRVAGAIELVHRVHDHVAERLVPGGMSLLRASPVKRQDWGDTAFLYDSYFLTRRARVARDLVVAQLLRRLGAVTDDLERFGLYGEPGQECDDPLVRALETELPGFIGDLVTVLVGGAVDLSRWRDRVPTALGR